MAAGSRYRTWLLLAVKLIVAVGLLTWLVRGKALDFGALLVLARSPTLMAANAAMFVTCSLVITTSRWRLLLGLADASIPFVRAVQLQMVGVFFNVVIPGNIGGDVVKALYVAREQTAEKRATILLIVFVERVMGLIGLIAMATLAIVVRGPFMWANPTMRPMMTITGALGAATLLGAPLAIWIFVRASGRLQRLTTSDPSKPSRLLGLLNKLVTSGRLLVARPRVLLGTLLLSMANHGVAMSYFTLLTRTLTNQDVDYSAVATVFPLGLLTLVLPVSPAGMGVGHVAFDRLYQAIGLSGGATIFNVFIIGQIVPCVLGVFPYLLLRSRGRIPDEAG